MCCTLAQTIVSLHCWLFISFGFHASVITYVFMMGTLLTHTHTSSIKYPSWKSHKSHYFIFLVVLPLGPTHVLVVKVIISRNGVFAALYHGGGAAVDPLSAASSPVWGKKGTERKTHFPSRLHIRASVEAFVVAAVILWV